MGMMGPLAAAAGLKRHEGPSITTPICANIYQAPLHCILPITLYNSILIHYFHKHRPNGVDAKIVTKAANKVSHLA